MKTLKSSCRIQFQDCDPLGHLNNSKYLDYFLNAREDQILENYGINLFELGEGVGLAWVVREHRIIYLKPALVREIVMIQTRMIRASINDVLAEMIMWDIDMKQIKALLWSNFVFIDLKTKTKTNHSQEHIRLFQEIIYDTEEIDFDHFHRRPGQILRNLSITPPQIKLS